MAATILLAFCLFLGGASRENEFRLGLVELAAIPCLALGIWSLARNQAGRSHALFLGVVLAIAALPLLQLVPLPAGIWTSLPGREQAVLSLSVVGVSPGWAPATLTPDFTWASFLALLPPMAIAIYGLGAPPDQQHRLVGLSLLATIVGMVLGAAQLVSGGEALYPWRTTDAGTVSGFFANRNHLATLCLMTLPFAVAEAVAASPKGRSRNADRGRFWLWLAYIGLVVVVLGVIRSRAGIALLLPTLIACGALAWVSMGREKPKPVIVLGLGIAAAAVAVLVFVSAGPVVERFGSAEGSDIRFQVWPLIAEQAQSVQPVGSGLGSFDAMYRSIEPLAQLDPTFLNHAHNEYLELWLEAGVASILIFGAFMAWFVRRTWATWRSGRSREREFQRAASIAIAIALLHSLVDYPLRTVALTAVFALCCVLLEFGGHARRMSSSR